MQACIYCPNDANGREHWMPRNLGTFRGSTRLLDRICSACNQRLGQLDEELVRTGPTGFYRTLLGIQGRHGPPRTSPFHYRAMQADQPTKMLMPALGRAHHILAEAFTDEQSRRSARPLRQVVLSMPGGRMECVPFPKGWSADHLRTAIANRGLEEGTLEEIYFDDDEESEDQETPYMREVRRLLSSVFSGTFRAQAYGGVGERTQNRLALVTGVNQIYLRALAKVAFHYFLWTCPVLRGHEPSLESLRAFVSEGEGDWEDFIELNRPQFLPLLREGCVPVRTSHFFYARLTPREATTEVQFFVGPNNVPPPPSRVRLAKNPLMIRGETFACHQACYFDDDLERTDGHDGELVPIDVWKRRIITP